MAHREDRLDGWGGFWHGSCMPKRRSAKRRVAKTSKPTKSSSLSKSAKSVKSVKSFKPSSVRSSRTKARGKTRASRILPSKSISQKEINRRFAAQKNQSYIKLILKKAEAATKAFKAKASDRGKLVFIGVKGERDPALKGRKGYLISVSKTGKKLLLKQKKHGYKPTRFPPELPLDKRFSKQRKAFTLSTRRMTARGTAIVRSSGKIKLKSAYEFSDKTVSKIAKDIRRALQQQQSQRIFVIRVIALCVLPDKTTRTYETQIPIQKADRIAIQLAGIKNFVSQKVYAFLARELSYDGFVSSGSSNHIRKLKGNRGKKRSEWKDRHGEAWRGRDDEVVRIEQIEWIIEQAK